jgi:hypothetical protein
MLPPFRLRLGLGPHAASEAYIKSQAREGRRLIPDRYDAPKTMSVRLRASANRSRCHIEPVSGTAKRKSKIGHQRLAPQSRRSKADFSDIAEQKLGRPSL